MLNFGRGGDEVIPEIQGVFANAISASITACMQKDKAELKSILIFNIRYAYTIVREQDGTKLETIQKELVKMQLDRMDWEELLVMATYYQAQAGIRPVTHYRPTANTFRRVQKELSDDAV